jgi:hypothetical protein
MRVYGNDHGDRLNSHNTDKRRATATDKRVRRSEKKNARKEGRAVIEDAIEAQKLDDEEEAKFLASFDEE